MITQAKRFLNSASTAEGHRVIDHPNGPVVVEGTAGSVTMSRHPIAEIPKDICKSNNLPDITKAVKDRILEEKLTLKECFAVRKLFPVRDAKKSYREGDIVQDGLALKKMGKAYFTDVKVAPESVIIGKTDVLETQTKSL